MKFYHGTNQQSWEAIQDEGVLWGGDTYHRTNGQMGYRYTYLSPEVEVAQIYGEVVLEVEYEPKGVGKGDNYGFDPPPGQTCWQFSVFNPIPLSDIVLL